MSASKDIDGNVSRHENDGVTTGDVKGQKVDIVLFELGEKKEDQSIYPSKSGSA